MNAAHSALNGNHPLRFLCFAHSPVSLALLLKAKMYCKRYIFILLFLSFSQNVCCSRDTAVWFSYHSHVYLNKSFSGPNSFFNSPNLTSPLWVRVHAAVIASPTTSEFSIWRKIIDFHLVFFPPECCSPSSEGTVCTASVSRVHSHSLQTGPRLRAAGIPSCAGTKCSCRHLHFLRPRRAQSERKCKPSVFKSRPIGPSEGRQQRLESSSSGSSSRGRLQPISPESEWPLVTPWPLAI